MPQESQFEADFTCNPTMSNQNNRDQGPRSPVIKNQAIIENQALQSLITQLNRIELREASGTSREDIQRLEMSCASKANVKNLETRVQHLEKSIHRLPADQIPNNQNIQVIMKMLLKHLATIQGKYKLVYTQRDEAKRRADGL